VRCQLAAAGRAHVLDVNEHHGCSLPIGSRQRQIIFPEPSDVLLEKVHDPLEQALPSTPQALTRGNEIREFTLTTPSYRD
jgi:hypothetical protein